MPQRVQKVPTPPVACAGAAGAGIGLTRKVRGCREIRRQKVPTLGAYRNQLLHNICNWLKISPVERPNFCLITTESYFSVIR